VSTKKSIRLLNERRDRIENRMSSIETRKVILPFDQMLGKENALFESLRFEELYLQFKLECEAWLSRADQERLAKLKARL
tara:strand:- start:416 stop:655 length:240 start_codon:yes stop_codon:yes gene_type:complete